MRVHKVILLILSGIFLGSCAKQAEITLQERLTKYTPVRLTADLSTLSDNQRRILPLLIDAAQAMDEAFWMQAYGEREELLAATRDDDERRFMEINYGPWDRLAGNEPFLAGEGPKPAGANFYPVDMSAEEFEAVCDESAEGAAALRSLYTMVRRDAVGGLIAVPYSQAFSRQYQLAAEKLRQAAALAENPAFKQYLDLRAEALLTDNYQPSDLAWMDMKDNMIDVVIGPIETYEDRLFGYKAASEAFVLIKDQSWSTRLSKYATMLPQLQQDLPVPAPYKRETPGTDSDLNVYDVIYYAGDGNAGSKTIAINLPNDEEVQLQKGTRRLQLKNTMRAKFEKILLPISNLLIDESQRENITFEAFFNNVMFHEVAHGLGIKNTIDGSGRTVRQALKEQASALEEGKADVLGLYMISVLHEQGELGEMALMDSYVTFLAGIFRSVRFGATSAHGVANLIRFNFFRDMEAFTREEGTGTYRAHPDKMQAAIDALSEKILRFQGDGDYEGVVTFVEQMGQIGPVLQADLDRLAGAGIPVDIIFEQGLDVLGLVP
ncbi:MAG: Zn-dependent hydrolase [Fidelibacterota bacterium]|nr:MAG: Zn-dependent hydrolase [Candidatus Neomarinimicrobiota bacterium]